LEHLFSDDDNDDDDDIEALMAELERIKKERAVDRLRKVYSFFLSINILTCPCL
jgi:hypothetical protein